MSYFQSVRKLIISVFCILPLICQSQSKDSIKRPNILFCIADDASYEHFSAYGFNTDWVQTPGFDFVAKNGLLFNNAYSPNAKCSPSRACILTGRNPWQLEAAANHVPFFPAKFITYMETLGENGYDIGFTGKGWAPGVTDTINGKPRSLTGPAYNSLSTKPPTSKMSPTNYAANFEKFLNEKPADKPFCFWYGGREPHRPYEYGSGIIKGHKKLSDIKNVPPFWIDNEIVRTDMLDYAYEVEYFDLHLQRILEILKKNNELNNTIIIVTSDNGMPFPRVKGHVYPFDNHLPLAIMWKNHIQNPGRKIDDYVSFIDFAPTFLEVAGLPQARTTMQPIQGKSLMNILDSKRSGVIDAKRDHVLLGRERTDVGRPKDEGYPVRAIIKNNIVYIKNYEPGRWPSGNPETGYMDTDGGPTKTEILEAHKNGHYMHLWQLSFGKKGSEELYDINKDPYCMTNLADNSQLRKIKSELKTQMVQELKSQKDPRMFGKGYIFDQYPYAYPDVRNFYERWYIRGEKIKANAGWIKDSDFEGKMPMKDILPKSSLKKNKAD